METPTVRILAEAPDLIEQVASLRWQEWRNHPGREHLQWWIDTTVRESGLDELPVTFVAVDGSDDVLGAVALGQEDIPECQDRTPWVVGMIVRTDRRGTGVGRVLMAHLEAFAARQGYETLWVATGPEAAGFYQRCGWQPADLISRPDWVEPTNILTRTGIRPDVSRDAGAI